MIPAWVEKSLEGMGVPGAIIFVLLLTVLGLVAYIRSMQAKADKIYGYRLAERDTLNKTLTDTAKVLEGVLHQVEERNELTAEQAELIAKQAQAFEILKVTILSQYDNIHEHSRATVAAVAAMAESIRTLSSMVIENRTIAQGHVLVVNGTLNDLKTEVIKAVRDASDGHIKEMRTLLGNVTRIENRRRKTP
jgi:hypothetical protein